MLRAVANGVAGCPADHPRPVYNYAVRPLCDKSLLRGCFIEGGDVEDACLTSYGRCYLAEYPDLKNPVNWAAVAAVAWIIALCAVLLKILIC